MEQYSPKNQQFILSQMPTASDVRPFKAWKIAGRSIIKGSKSLRVYLPGGRTAPVFDISQTKPCAPRHQAAANTERQIAAEQDAFDRAYVDYDAAIAAGDIPADLDFDIWYELREETRIAIARGEQPAPTPTIPASTPDYTIATTGHDGAPVIIAQVEHHDVYAPIAGGSQELDTIDQETAPAVSAPTTGDVFSSQGPAAYRHSSFDPDRRWQRDREEFQQEIATLREQFTPIATSDEQRALLDAELDRYAANYQKHYAGIYGAASRTASTMITGRSNFNVSRNQKWLDIEHRRLTEFLEWREKAQAAIKRAILDARTPEQKSDAMTSRLIKWAASELDIIDKIAAAERGEPGVPSWYAGMNKSAFTTSFTGKLHREVKNGNLAEVQACLRWLDTQQQTTGKQLITKRNSVWSYLDQQPAEPTPEQESAVIYTGDGVTVTANHEVGRYQIQHDEKPDAAVRSELKRHGWKWSPQHSAWQRQLTNATLHNLTQLFPELAS